MEVKSQQERIKAYRREICERAENIVDIHKNLWADDIAVSRTITGESYLPLSRHAANWPAPFLRARKPSPFSSPDVLLLRFTLHLETLRFHLIGMSFVGSCLRNTNCDPGQCAFENLVELVGQRLRPRPSRFFKRIQHKIARCLSLLCGAR